MIVVGATTFVSATFRRGSVPARAASQALRFDRVAVSEAILAELLDVLDWPRLALFVDPALRAELVGHEVTSKSPLDTTPHLASPRLPHRQ